MMKKTLGSRKVLDIIDKITETKRKLFSLLLLFTMALVIPSTTQAADLLIAKNGASSYQIVIPDHAQDEVVDRWLAATAKLMQVAFHKNGFEVPVVPESKKAADKPSIYLGATSFAHGHGIHTAFDDWTYVTKAIGKDLVIAGNDHQDPNNTSIALLGTVKGACDFMREHMGVRFLFFNHIQGAPATNADGSLDIDTRSITFLPVKQVVVPADLNVQKVPMMVACPAAHSHDENFYLIANNFFPMRSSVIGAEVKWQDVISLKKYSKSHPEYFALLPNGKRASDPDSGFIIDTRGQVPINVANPDVQKLMAQAIEDKIKAGASTVHLGTLDVYYLDRCNDAECNQLFGMPAKDMEQVHARGRSGKLWKVLFAIADRVYEKYPKARIEMLNYQDTPIDSPFIHEVGAFPKNVIPKVQFTLPSSFDILNGVSTPAGIAGFGEIFTGFGMAGRYTPQRTPQYVSDLVRAMEHSHMKWLTVDGSMGDVRGMQGPAYYIFGRMMDDPSADWHDIYQEFITAAFGNVASPVKSFFDLQQKQLALYSGFLNWGEPAFRIAVGQGNKWTYLSIYTPEYLASAGKLLTSAEQRATDPDVKARLHLIRIEFDYLRGLAKILTLQNAWEIHPTHDSLIPVLDAIDAWRANLKKLAGGTTEGQFETLSDWPQIRPFNGHYYTHASLSSPSYHQMWYKTATDWDTMAIRNGILTEPHQLQVPTVDQAPTIDSDAWNSTPIQVLREHLKMPLNTRHTTFKVLRDSKNLYVRIDSLYPSVHPEKLPVPKTEKDVLKHEYVELAVQPKADGPIYHLAVSPVKDARYDAILRPNGNKSMATDVSWNGNWEYTYHVTGKEGPWSLPGRVWMAWFKIPFTSLGADVPTSGAIWGFNVARDRGQYLVWSDGQSQSIISPKTMGELKF